MNRRNVAAGASAVAVAAAVGLGVVLLDGSETPPAQRVRPPASSTSSHPTKTGLTADDVVDDPRAIIEQVAVSPTDPDVRAGVWNLCTAPRCTTVVRALAITDDGFASRHTVLGPTDGYLTVQATPGDSFYVSQDYALGSLIRADGSEVDVRRTGEDATMPKQGVIVVHGQGVFDWLWLDPETGEAHELSTPAGTSQVVVEAGGRLRGTTATASVWSEDGAATWQRHRLPTAEASLFSPVPSSVPGTLAVLAGADGATFIPLLATHRSTDAGFSWQETDTSSDPQAYGQGVAVLPDGRLLLAIATWSDATLKRPGRHPAGLYVSDWSDLRPVAPGLGVVGVDVGEDQVTVYATEGTTEAVGSAVSVSADGGETWESIRMR